MEKDSNEIKIANSRFGSFMGILFPILISYIFIDNKYGNKIFAMKPISDGLFWTVLSFCIIFVFWVGREIFSPTNMLFINEKGIKVSLGQRQRKKTLFIPWSKIDKITKTEVRKLGSYTYNSKTKEREPVMISGIKLISSDKYRECGFYPFVFVRGDSVYITKTQSTDDEFMDKLFYLKEKSEIEK